MKIIFDLETNGLPTTQGFDSYHHPSLVHYYNSSRIIQIGYIVIDDHNNKIHEYSSLILPEDFKIDNEHIHGISYEKAMQQGKKFKDVLDIFFTDVQKCNTLIAHNIKFDYNILMSELFRLGLSDMIWEFNKKNRYCTMIESKKIFGFLKNPKLVELFSYLYEGKVWKQTHDALDDATYCLACYVKLLK
jgi:DNA polymerase-3 subunit alpha